ncbi:prenyltransferase [Pediococcus claussenii]|uniref:UbiA prenyltransferase family protein n=1 Tax=Pediococcus claussenii (strain ATCC BAA-344 / DSM 14800 / JCM 18046 / KCTC 3811 / LMG 21948 / P06) TaxID=701521 RepID=G8PCB7_PEDCP|nr:prenyltransferase [Pediococcus claussenii]AEV94902.1 ubiA prenyltransferase family protein [Pediococcus claussenii ATCC BAA-344]ANZ70098.1 1,4-dihydroxy-2-naphthoate prenyltransferase [Pediococcus claussenii]ANZ71913.1 1,4-dihydroxy-2-naphthoate prenyltransferase [Pediococcus claussenii]KRN18847.1 hypothetical protein IV79_GL000345 [Pediococcus claussenii]
MVSKWLKWPVFVELTEIYTAPLNVLWFILGAATSQFLYKTYDFWNVLLCLICVFIFDLAVNVADNYFDYLHANDEEFKQTVNPLGRLKLPIAGVRNLTIVLFVISVIPGALLLWRVGPTLIVFGLIGYLIGIFYTAGSKPINATPFAELIVALSISFFIQLTCVFISIHGVVPFTLGVIGKTFLIALPQTLIFYSLQLANNTVDLDEDIKNDRHTLPYFIGKKHSFQLIKVLIAIGIVWPIINILLGLSPLVVILSCLSFFPIRKGSHPFFTNPDKKTTYLPFIKSNSLFFILYTLLYAIGTWLHL